MSVEEQCVDYCFDLNGCLGYYRFFKWFIKFLVRDLFITFLNFVSGFHNNCSCPFGGFLKVYFAVSIKNFERLSLFRCKVVFCMGKD